MVTSPSDVCPQTETEKMVFHFNVNMYRLSPMGFDNIFNIVAISKERLKLYKILENDNLCLDEIREELKNSPFKVLLEKKGTWKEKQEARRIDYISHYFLRVAHADNPKPFIRNEIKWFKLRFDLMKNIEKRKYLEKNNLYPPLVSEETKTELNLNMEECYKINFREALLLVRERKNHLIKGYMYISSEDLIYRVLNLLETELTNSLREIKKILPTSTDHQLKTILELLDCGVKTKKNNYAPSEPVTLDNIDEEQINFPLCMRFQHETLRETHHLKYFSRMQYGLFLKGLGLSLEESLEFWKKEFLHDMPEHRFKSRYSYLFKHQYGTVGGKIDWAPYSCKKIFEQSVCVNQIHGCPYKTWDDKSLKRKLKEFDFLSDDIDEIIELRKKKLYGEACAKYFSCVNGRKLDTPVTHPNLYYLQSCRRDDEIIDIEDIFCDYE